MADWVTCSLQGEKEQRRQVGPTSTTELKKLILLVRTVHKGMLPRQETYIHGSTLSKTNKYHLIQRTKPFDAMVRL